MGKLKLLFFRLIAHFPSKLPRGSTAFEDFCHSLFLLYNIPDTDSYRHSVAVMIQHLPNTCVYRSKAWFAASIYNAQAREVAFYKIQEIQKKDRERQEAEKAQETKEAVPN